MKNRPRFLVSSGVEEKLKRMRFINAALRGDVNEEFIQDDELMAECRALL